MLNFIQKEFKLNDNFQAKPHKVKLPRYLSIICHSNIHHVNCPKMLLESWRKNKGLLNISLVNGTILKTRILAEK